MSDVNLPRFKGFVSGSEDEQKEQISKINKFCETHGFPSGKDIEFLSNWNTINEDLKCGDCIIIDDLKRLAGDWRILANKLLALTKNSVHVVSVNEEQCKLLNWDERLKHNTNLILGGGEERALAGLQIMAKQIFPDTES
jgi:hypothetical protein